MPISKRYLSLFAPSFLTLSLLSSSVVAQLVVLENGQALKTGVDTGIHSDTPTRLKIDLSGTWSVSTDGELWQNVGVPSSIDAADQFTFRRTFALSELQLADLSYKLVALGIHHDAEIYINDIYIGRHVGGYTTAEMDVPENVLQIGSENSLQIIVHNRIAARGTIPVRMQSWGWRNYGGILRDIYLLGTPRLWIDSFIPRIAYDETTTGGRISAQSVVTSRGYSALIRDTAVAAQVKELTYLFGLELVDRGTETVVASSLPQILSLEANKDLEIQTSMAVAAPRIWRPEQPDLYFLRASIYTQEGKQRTIIDQVSKNVGFSAVTIHGNQFFENGVRLRLKGVTWREDSPVHGASLTYEEMERDMALIKSLGANAVRFAFHPPHPYLINLCARYGLYALIEAPIWDVPAAVLAEDAFKPLAESVIRDMVERDRANPAVFAWGIGDLLDPTDERVGSFVAEMASVVRSIDTRPVYAGTLPFANDVSASSVDFAAATISVPDLKQFRDVLQRLKASHKNRPVVVLSYGIQVDHENRSGYRDPRSQEAQARFYLQHMAAVKESGIAGGFVAALADWRGDRPVLSIPAGDRYMHPLGLTTANREKRLAFDVVRAQYQDEKFPAIPAGTYRVAFPATHVITGLFVIILFGYQYSYNRRFGESVKRALLRSYNFFADLRDRRDVPAFATFILAFCSALAFAVVLSGILYHYRANPTADALMNVVFVNDALKEEIIASTWQPVRGIPLLTAAVLAWFAFSTVVIKIVALLARARVHMAQSWILTVWGALPLIVLSPLGMSLFKIMETPEFVLPAILVIFAVCVWVGLRILKAASVVFDLNPVRTYVLALLVTAAVGASLFIYLDSGYALRASVEHIVHVAGAAG
ncbi:MAG: hypothetical protein A2X67_10625 [Ignavibacteria bacterium GWA2_55_11]|nr:MAG: hypothetical protein A2X67_10625 [Ignavibacteria bacterium GWA2_55_11]